MKLTRTQFIQGQYTGILEVPTSTKNPPKIILIHAPNPPVTCTLTPIKSGSYEVTTSITNSDISDGVSIFLIVEDGNLDILDSFTIQVSGADEPALKEDVALLRDELDMLKRAFRNHARKGPPDAA